MSDRVASVASAFVDSVLEEVSAKSESVLLVLSEDVQLLFGSVESQSMLSVELLAVEFEFSAAPSVSVVSVELVAVESS
jgi:hypothetical protein